MRIIQNLTNFDYSDMISLPRNIYPYKLSMFLLLINSQNYQVSKKSDDLMW